MNFRFAASIALHTLIFLIGAVTIWQTRYHDTGSMLITFFFLIYLLAIKLKQEDSLPIMAIFAVFKIIEFPIAVALFSTETFYQYLMFVALSDIALIIALSHGYQSDFVRRLCRTTSPKQTIKQVRALNIVLGFSAVHILVIALEVKFFYHQYGIHFFYSHFTEFRTILKILEFYILWSIFIDGEHQSHINQQKMLDLINKKAG